MTLVKIDKNGNVRTLFTGRIIGSLKDNLREYELSVPQKMYQAIKEFIQRGLTIAGFAYRD